MKKLIFPSLLLLLCCFHGYTQQTDDDVPARRDRFLRLDFLGLMDPFDNTFSVGMQHSLSRHFSVAVDAGWIFHSQYFRNAKSSNGILLRPAFRWYPRVEGRGFVETELHYKMVS